MMQPGSQIGRYQLLSLLGEGGMAEVWKARNMTLERVVAMKFLLAKFVPDQDLQRRFLNEARIQAKLNHPNIVAAFDADSEKGRSYMVMDYVDGRSLDKHLSAQGGKPLPVAHALSISRGVLAALQYAHTLPSGAIVHRDVKPSNILLDRNGRSRLADFGIAVVLNQTRDTRTGIAPGSVYYMSPEQIQAPRTVDHRSDVYSFGCVLYEMLTGRPPFGADSDSEFTIKQMHVYQAPEPVQKFNREISPELAGVVMRGLSKDRNQRFASAAEMAKALEMVARTTPAGARAAGVISDQPTEVAREPVRTGNTAPPLRATPPPRTTSPPAGKTQRPCPFCSQMTSATICSSCGRDTSAPRRVCSSCGKMVPERDKTCWNCNQRLRSDLAWKVPVAILIFVVLILLQLAARH
ncbi:MAG TPA: serine/threonine-protein kinase [Terriglobales bacterium]|jgi:serine/threonine-protein kinase